MLSHKVWHHNDVMLCDVRKLSMTVLWVNFSTFSNAKKSPFYNISPRAQLTYKIYPIKSYREWTNLNTVKILFCKVAVPLSNLRSKDLKTTKNVKTRLPYPYLAPYNTREEGQHRRISADPKNRNVQHTKKRYDTFIHWLWFFPPSYKADSGGSWTFSFSGIREVLSWCYDRANSLQWSDLEIWSKVISNQYRQRNKCTLQLKFTDLRNLRTNIGKLSSKLSSRMEANFSREWFRIIL